ncbi:tetratricopeptide repeat protein [Hymenobacter caeli]|uniref:histidine kinase n=1 Tax=Hymenobacter caeli TaxID=2735894 RepID=A0ABX2FUU9_9BACT|nr:tetratricopeptide repeat-containing sensor histidine kinase [Hymenobacter caeli]NRT20259.1 signal transduction histidine kinase [Hymenobacter caeli]
MIRPDTLARIACLAALAGALGCPAAPAAPPRPKPTAVLDSLRHRAAALPPDTARAQTLNELGYALAQLGQFAEARPVLRQAQRLSERLHFATGQVRALTGLGTSYQNEGQFPRARAVLDSAVALGQRLGEQRRLGAALLGRARLCNAQDDYACALASVQAARQFFAARGDWAHTAQALNGLGSIYVNRGDYPRALAALFEAVQLARRHHDAQTEVNSLGNIGNTYLKQEEYAQALRAYEQLLPRLDSVPDQRVRPIVYQNMATAMTHLHRPETEAYFQKSMAGFEALHEPADVGQVLGSYAHFLLESGRRPEAIRAYARALALLRAADDNNAAADVLNGLARAYRQGGQPALAAARAREALALAQRIHDVADVQAAASLLAGLAKAGGDYRRALAYTEQAQAANDSLFSRAKSEQIGRLQGDFQLGQERARRQALARTSAAQAETLRLRQRQLRGLVAGLVAVALGGLVLAWLARQLRRRNRLVEKQRAELTELNATKDRLFSIIGHDLRAPLHALHAFVELVSGPALPPERLRQYTRHLTQTLDQTLILLENLLSWAALQMRVAGPPRTEALALAAAVDDAFALLGPAAEAAGLALHSTLAGGEWVRADPAAVRLVLRNLLGNALKFTPAGGRVTVAAAPHGPGWQLAVADTGRGLPVPTPRQLLPPAGLPRRPAEGPGRAPGAGLGLVLSRDYARRSGGELEVASAGPGQGTTFYLSLPAAEAELIEANEPKTNKALVK